jgi:uncharacterized membrane protein YkvA (DUF1232 family)
MGWRETWHQKARVLKRETFALVLAYRDPRTPWYAKVFVGLVVAYAFSPLDLIPDPIPVVGYLDDLVLIPLGVYLALKLIPAEVMSDARETADASLNQGQKLVSTLGMVIVILLWLAVAAGVGWLILKWLGFSSS